MDLLHNEAVSHALVDVEITLTTQWRERPHGEVHWGMGLGHRHLGKEVVITLSQVYQRSPPRLQGEQVGN